MRELKDAEFLTELRCLRTHLEPVLNSRMKNVLNEAERRLIKKNSSLNAKTSANKMTKEQILNKWLNKY